MSSQPSNQKINIAWNFINRVLNISNDEYKLENIKKIKSTLHKNNYPKNMTNTLLQKWQYRNKEFIKT